MGSKKQNRKDIQKNHRKHKANCTPVSETTTVFYEVIKLPAHYS